MEPSAPPSEPSFARRVIFRAALALCVVYLLHPVWSSLPPFRAELGPRDPAQARFIENFSMNIAAKATVGLVEFVRRSDASADLNGQIDKLLRAVGGDTASKPSRHAHQSRLILFTHLGLEEAADAARADLEAAEDPTDDQEREINRLIERLYFEGAEIAEGELAQLEKRFGYAGRLSRLRGYEVAGDARAAALRSSIGREAGVFIMVFMGGAAAALGLGLTGLVLLIVFAVQAKGGRIEWRFTPGHVPAFLLWEAFTLYLMAMILVPILSPLLARWPLISSVFLQGLMLLAACYPLLFGVKPATLRSALGLTRGPGALREIMAGPAGYAASLPLLVVAVFVLSIILQYTGMDISTGVHPIVPMLESSETPAIAIVALVFLAVAAAPLIEEVMFRGCFYAALRARLGARGAILISALFFAGIHPQGLIGLPMLTVVGLMLAVLREWRGSLLAPIAAHACVNGVTMMILLGLT